jgi:hypothetical protein
MLSKIWGFHGGGYEERRILGYKNSVRTSQETNYFSATEPCKLSPCKIWGFHGGGYEECCLLGYKNSIHPSQNTHYVSVTEPMLCKIWCIHGGDYEECRLLGYKNPFRTSQETHYFPATEPSQLMLCKIWGSQRWLWRMSSCGMWSFLTLVRTDALEKRIVSIIRVQTMRSYENRWQ